MVLRPGRQRSRRAGFYFPMGSPLDHVLLVTVSFLLLPLVRFLIHAFMKTPRNEVLRSLRGEGGGPESALTVLASQGSRVSRAPAFGGQSLNYKATEESPRIMGSVGRDLGELRYPFGEGLWSEAAVHPWPGL